MKIKLENGVEIEVITQQEKEEMLEISKYHFLFDIWDRI